MTNILGISAYYHDSRRVPACATARSSPPRRRSASRARSTTPAFRDHAVALLPARRRHRARRRSTPSSSTTSRSSSSSASWRPTSAVAPRGLRSFLHGDAAVAQGEALHAATCIRRSELRRRTERPGCCFAEHHESHAASAFYPVAVRRGGDPHHGRRRRVGDRRRYGVGARQATCELLARAALPALARPALLGVHLLHRLQGQLRRVQADGPGALRRAALRRTHPRPARRPEGGRLASG